MTRWLFICTLLLTSTIATAQNWINVSYRNCLTTDLPCACQQKEKYPLLRLDSGSVTVYEGIVYDPNSYALKSTGNNMYQVGSTGAVRITGDTLYYTDTTGIKNTFVRYGTSQDDQWAYYKEHIQLFDQALAKRNYPALEKIVRTDSLHCNCNPELGVVNFVSAKNKGWLLEKKDNTVFIYEWTNMPDGKMADYKMKKRLVGKYEW